jgi:hypothetical protein
MSHPTPCAASWRLCLLALLVGASALPALAAGNTATSKGARKPAKVTFVEAPSSESAAARKQRLKRECKGRPNAGMCLGHTR